MSAFPIWAWVGFTALIVVLLLLDLFVLARAKREISFRRATILSLFWIVLALLFGAVVFALAGPQRGGEYLAGYVIEKSLSVDNVFVFALIFSYFAVPARYQYRVLFWGVVGALVLRAIFIALGAQLLERYDWMVYVFGIFLIYTGIRMAFHRDEEVHPERNPLLLLVRRALPMTPDFRGERFFTRQAGKLYATPLLAVIAVVGTTDVVFAVDSVPAIFAITTDTFVVYTANIMAILGLRALYFALAAMVHRFHYLKYALALVLVFIGGKIFWNQIVGKLDPTISLGVTLALIAGGVVFSLWKTKGEQEAVSG